MRRWKVAGAPCNPNGITVNWYSPDGVANAVFSLASLVKGDLPVVNGGGIESSAQTIDEVVHPRHGVGVMSLVVKFC